MATSRISREDPTAHIDSELLLRLSQNPDIGLVAIINWRRERVLRGEAVVNAEYGYSKAICPLSSVILMTAGVMTEKAATMKVDNGKVEMPRIFPGKRLAAKYSDLDMASWIVLPFIHVHGYVR